MTNRNQTRIILKEVLGTLATIGAVGAIGAGIRGAIKSRELSKYQFDPQGNMTNKPTRPAGFSGRVVQNFKNTFKKIGQSAQRSMIEKSAAIDTETHSRIASKYNLKPTDYAVAMGEQTRKNLVVDTLNDPVVIRHLQSQGHVKTDASTGKIISGHENINIEDLGNIHLAAQQIKSGKTPTAFNLTPINPQHGRSLRDVIDTPTRLEILDFTNPSAREFREKMTRTMITPKSQEMRAQALQHVDASRNRSENMKQALRADKELQKSFIGKQIAVKKQRDSYKAWHNELSDRAIGFPATPGVHGPQDLERNNQYWLRTKKALSQLDFWNR